LKRHQHEYLIVSHRKKRPYKNVNALRSAFFRVARLAGWPQGHKLRLSDLRRSGALIYGMAGATDDELRSITGHLTREVVKRYIPISDEMAANAMRKRDNYLKNLYIVNSPSSSNTPHYINNKDL
jgi:integrase